MTNKETTQTLQTETLQQEFPCSLCGTLADRLVHYYKLYPDDVLATIENPKLCCAACEAEARYIIDLKRGGIEGTTKILFSEIVRLPVLVIATQMLAKQGRTLNHLAYPQWRKKIWRIHWRFQKAKGEKK